MTTTFDQSKDALKEAAQRQMQSFLRMPDWSIRQRLVLTCRILFDGGHDSGLPGQITARGDKAGTFYTQQLGVGFGETTGETVLLVDEDLHVLEGSGMPNPANRFHAWLYRKRPDVNCIVHTHALHAATLSMLGVPLIVSQMDATVLFDDCAFLKEWPGVPVGNEEGEIISEAIGSKRAILLAHHGMLVACATVEEACVVSLAFERAAKMQLLASASGKIREIPEDLGREAHDWLLGRKRIEATFAHYARRILKNDANCLD